MVLVDRTTRFSGDYCSALCGFISHIIKLSKVIHFTIVHLVGESHNSTKRFNASAHIVYSCLSCLFLLILFILAYLAYSCLSCLFLLILLILAYLACSCLACSCPILLVLALLVLAHLACSCHSYFFSHGPESREIHSRRWERKICSLRYLPFSLGKSGINWQCLSIPQWQQHKKEELCQVTGKGLHARNLQGEHWIILLVCY